MSPHYLRDDGSAAAAASPRDSPFVRLLSEAEETCSTAEGAERLWQDKARLAAVLEMLKRPASGSAYTQWAASNELRKAAKVCELIPSVKARTDALLKLFETGCSATAYLSCRQPGQTLVTMVSGGSRDLSTALVKHAFCVYR